MSESVFGRIVLPQHVRDAVAETIKAFAKDYLAEIERAEELPTKALVPPRSYVTRDDDRLEKWPEDQLPAVIIMSPGTAARPRVDGEGEYAARWAVNVAVVASARDEIATSDLAGYYAGAIRALLVHKGTLQGFANSTTWKGERYGDLPADAERTLATAIENFEVQVENVVTRGGGPSAPSEEPYEDTDWPDVQSVEVDLKPTEAK